MTMKKMLVFHRSIEPYRIDFFNDLSKQFDLRMCLYFEYLKKEDNRYGMIENELNFTPEYFKKIIHFLGREIPVGFINFIQKNKPDIILVNEYSESFWAAHIYKLMFRKKYKIVSICDDSVDIFNKERGFHSLARNYAVKYIDGVILCNESICELYRLQYPMLNAIVMPIIHKENKYLANYQLIKEKANDFVLKNNLYGKRVFLFVGRISPEKNLEYLLNSFIDDHVMHPENILYLVGGTSVENEKYRMILEKIIEKNNAANYIIRMGRMDGDELKKMFYISQVLILPSLREAFGAVANEALLFGCQVMISSVAGATCLISEDNGEIIDISKAKIDFKYMNEKVPTLNNCNIHQKCNMMKYTYDFCMNNLIEWFKRL